MKILDLTNPRHQKIVAEEIARAKRILEQQTKISKYKVANFIKDNEDKINAASPRGKFIYKIGPVDRTIFELITFLDKGNPSQYLLENIITAIDELEGFSIDVSDFYNDPKPTGDWSGTYTGGQFKTDKWDASRGGYRAD